MAKPPDDDRRSLVTGMQLASRAMTVSLEMALPPALGYWLDKKLGTAPWLVIVFAILGFWTAMRHLLQLSNSNNESGRDQDSNDASK